MRISNLKNALCDHFSFGVPDACLRFCDSVEVMDIATFQANIEMLSFEAFKILLKSNRQN